MRSSYHKQWKPGAVVLRKEGEESPCGRDGVKLNTFDPECPDYPNSKAAWSAYYANQAIFKAIKEAKSGIQH
jgi:hypothetical protein